MYLYNVKSKKDQRHTVLILPVWSAKTEEAKSDEWWDKGYNKLEI